MFADECREHFLAKPGAVEETPFGPDALVYKVAGKMFGLLAEDRHTGLMRANLKCDPGRSGQLRRQHPQHVLPGYHMHKRLWNTVVLDGTLDPGLVRELADHSYALVVAALPKAARRTLTDPPPEPADSSASPHPGASGPP
ncbi:MmcQ/YjbR family DNA-binding protein [soil metagenome]